MERAGREGIADRLQQRGIRHGADRPGPPASCLRSQRLPSVDAAPRQPPDPRQPRRRAGAGEIRWLMACASVGLKGALPPGSRSSPRAVPARSAPYRAACTASWPAEPRSAVCWSAPLRKDIPPLAQRRCRDAEIARNRLHVLAAQQRNTASILRLRDIRPPRQSEPGPDSCTSRSAVLDRCRLLLSHRSPPARTASALMRCLIQPCRGGSPMLEIEH